MAYLFRPVKIMSSTALVALPLLAVANGAVEPLLDVMWHYDCVVSPKSTLANLSFSQAGPCDRPTKENRHYDSLAWSDTTASAFRCTKHVTVQATAETVGTAAKCCLLDASATQTSNKRHNFGLQSNGKTLLPDPSQSLPNPICAVTLSEADRHWLQRVFETFDENTDGMISKDELVRSMEKLGICMPDESVASLLRCMPLKVSDHLDLNEFLLLYQSSSNQTDELYEESGEDGDQDLREAFGIFDKDRDGFISPCELQEVLCSLGFDEAHDLAACVDMIRQVDEDMNGQVDFSEFKKMMCMAGLQALC